MSTNFPKNKPELTMEALCGEVEYDSFSEYVKERYIELHKLGLSNTAIAEKLDISEARIDAIQSRL